MLLQSIRSAQSPIRCCAALAVIIAGICTTSMNWRFSYQLGANAWDGAI